MNPPLSAIVRIICGLVLIILAGASYMKHRVTLREGARVELLGFTTALEPWQITLIFAVIALIGLIMLIAGVASFLKTPR